MSWHLKLKHIPFSDIKRLAEQGIIPKKFFVSLILLSGKATLKTMERERQDKTKQSICQPHRNFPGANTSTDQMISPFGELIPQMKGSRLMQVKYYAATIFVDHFSDYTYVHLMQDTTAEATIEAKNAYESLLHSFSHTVSKYMQIMVTIQSLLVLFKI